MKTRAVTGFFIIFCLFFVLNCGQKHANHQSISGREKDGTSVPKTNRTFPKADTQTAVQATAAAFKSKEVRLCASVPSVTDNYVPLFYTNVFIRTEDESLADKIEDDLVSLHKYFDAYRCYHGDDAAVIKNVKILNEHIALGKSLNIDTPLAELIAESLRMIKLTAGNFNVFLEPVSRLYEGKFSAFPIENTDPEAGLIASALNKVLSGEEAERAVILNGNELSFLPHKDSFDYSFNFGAIAKGYAAKKILDSYPDGTYMLSLGSSTIAASGKNYRIGVASPYYKTLALIQLDLPGGISLSTSGTLNNYYISASDSHTIRTHILDPRTGYSHDWWWSVVVISDNALVSDALSTALFNVNDEKQILNIIDAVKTAYGCSIEVCFVKDENRENKTLSLLMTEGFAPYIRNDYEGIGIIAQKIIQSGTQLPAANSVPIGNKDLL